MLSADQITAIEQRANAAFAQHWPAGDGRAYVELARVYVEVPFVQGYVEGYRALTAELAACRAAIQKAREWDPLGDDNNWHSIPGPAWNALQACLPEPER